MNRLVYSYIYFINQEIKFAKLIEPDTPIEQQFDTVLTELIFLIASIKFEMNHGIPIPEAFLDYRQTPRQLAERIARVRPVADEEFDEFIKYKEETLSTGYKQLNLLKIMNDRLN